MYSDNPIIQQLCALLSAHGVRDVVCCPGSRNAGIVHTLSEMPEITCLPMTDERSAAFFAIGRAQATDRPVAVCCTSGSALLNMHPAVAEAFYREVPLVVVSADRPRAWIGQMDGQTLPQPNAFGPLVHKSVDLPENDVWHANRLVNEAMLASDRGPVHINIPVSEPIYEFHTVELPRARVIRRGPGRLVETRAKICLLLGQDKHILNAFYTKTFPVLCEHLSNTRAIGNLDALFYGLSDEEKEALRPDILVTMGGHVVSKRAKQYFRDYPPREHWHVSANGDVVDTFCCLTRVISMEPQAFLSLIADKGDAAYAQRWADLSSRIKSPKLPYSAPSIVGRLIESLPPGTTLHLANSSAVRYAELFPMPDGVRVQCNRGVNGIEGSLSTALGHASASEDLNVILIGDLSFFYDMNALWQCVPNNVRILLINNGGGEIFHTLPINPDAPSRSLICAEHNASAEAWARDCGLTYHRVQCDGTLERALRVMQGDEPCLIEAFIDPERDTELLKHYYRYERMDQD